MILSPLQKFRYTVLGIGLVVVVVAIAVLSIMEFNRDFASRVTVHLDSSRAGLLMTDGSAVRVRGVTVGYVDSVQVTADGARIELGLEPGQVHLIPADVTARIVPPTLFGSKYVDLVPPAGSQDAPAIRADATITATHVTVEINNTFEHLMQLLQATQPAKVKAALTALAGALDGNGTNLGRLITQLDAYLREINPSLGYLRTDLPLASSVLGTYSNLTPNLLRTLSNLTTTSDSIEANRVSLDAFLLSLTTVSKNTSTFLSQTSAPLMTALNVLKTPLTTLARYAPEFPCFFQGMANVGLPLAEKAIGGVRPGLNLLAELLPPEAPYTYPKDLPVVRADVGPRCYGLPDIPMGTKFTATTFDVGVDPYKDETAKGLSLPELLQILFGTATGAGS